MVSLVEGGAVGPVSLYDAGELDALEAALMARFAARTTTVAAAPDADAEARGVQGAATAFFRVSRALAQDEEAEFEDDAFCTDTPGVFASAATAGFAARPPPLPVPKPPLPLPDFSESEDDEPQAQPAPPPQPTGAPARLAAPAQAAKPPASSPAFRPGRAKGAPRAPSQPGPSRLRAAAPPAPSLALPSWAVQGSGLTIGAGPEFALLGSIGVPPTQPGGNGGGGDGAAGASPEVAAQLEASREYTVELVKALREVKARRAANACLRASLAAPAGGGVGGGGAAASKRLTSAGQLSTRGARAGGFSRLFRVPQDASPGADGTVAVPGANEDAKSEAWALACSRVPVEGSGPRAKLWSATERTQLRSGVAWQLQRAHMAAALDAAAAGGSGGGGSGGGGSGGGGGGGGSGSRQMTLEELRAVAAAAPKVPLFAPRAKGEGGKPSGVARNYGMATLSPLVEHGTADAEDDGGEGGCGGGDGGGGGGEGSAALSLPQPQQQLALAPAPDAPVTSQPDVSSVDWAHLAALRLPGRCGTEAAVRWSFFEAPGLNLSPEWSPGEDAALRALCVKHAGHNWEAVAVELGADGVAARRVLPFRSPAMCLRRYVTALCDRAVTRNWSPSEDARLIELVAAATGGAGGSGGGGSGGNASSAPITWHKWGPIGLALNRDPKACQQRYCRALKPDMKKGKWGREEDDKLRAAVAALGAAWTKVSAAVGGRTDMQCRERWVNCLDPKLKFGKWTPDEDAKLRSAYAQLARGGEAKVRWAAVAALVAPRTDNQCMLRHRHLVIADGKAAARAAAGEEEEEEEEKPSKKKAKAKGGKAKAGGLKRGAPQKQRAKAGAAAAKKPRRAATKKAAAADSDSSESGEAEDTSSEGEAEEEEGAPPPVAPAPDEPPAADAADDVSSASPDTTAAAVASPPPHPPPPPLPPLPSARLQVLCGCARGVLHLLTGKVCDVRLYNPLEGPSPRTADAVASAAAEADAVAGTLAEAARAKAAGNGASQQPQPLPQPLPPPPPLASHHASLTLMAFVVAGGRATANGWVSAVRVTFPPPPPLPHPHAAEPTPRRAHPWFAHVAAAASVASSNASAPPGAPRAAPPVYAASDAAPRGLALGLWLRGAGVATKGAGEAAAPRGTRFTKLWAADRRVRAAEGLGPAPPQAQTAAAGAAPLKAPPKKKKAAVAAADGDGAGADEAGGDANAPANAGEGADAGEPAAAAARGAKRSRPKKEGDKPAGSAKKAAKAARAEAEAEEAKAEGPLAGRRPRRAAAARATELLAEMTEESGGDDDDDDDDDDGGAAEAEEGGGAGTGDKVWRLSGDSDCDIDGGASDGGE